MLLSDFDFKHSPQLIAEYPLAERDASRLMVVNRQTGTWEHKIFRDIVDYFKAGDVLVLNNSKVFPCRLFSKKPTGGKVEVFLLNKVLPDESDRNWSCLITDSKKIPAGTRLDFAENFYGIVSTQNGDTRNITLHYTGDLFERLQQHAHIPLPRYIKRVDEDADTNRYQTVFAKKTGSVAAPTAGFHFTPALLESLKNKGVEIVEVTLHVGIGTFLSVKEEKIENHQMHAEYFSLSEESATAINKAKEQGRRITAVGTTATRVLETAAKQNRVVAGSGMTTIFIYPPYTFKIVDRLITNFHQPKSTLLMLVSALAGRELILKAYQDALEKEYRLFSYGDAMLIE